VGAFRYAEDASTEALILSYAINGEPVVGVNLTKDTRKLEPLFNAIEAGIQVGAHNSQFERVIWEKVCMKKLGWRIQPKPSQWDCTAARAASLSLPRSLEGSGLALKLGVIKDPLGKKLISKFSKPQKGGERIYPKDDPAAFRKFVEYCQQDTVVEREEARVLPPLNAFEHEVYLLDYRINDAGIPIDVPLIRKTLDFIDEHSRLLVKKAQNLTGIKPSQRDRLLEWLQDQGMAMESLQAAEVERAIADPDTPKSVRKLLDTRIEISRAGTKKLKTMLACASSDGRVRGSFWYHSASTGRWGSGGVQFHNLGKPDDAYPQDDVLDLLNQDALDLFYDRPLTAIAKSIRGFLAAPTGREFLVADYNAIEARALAWLANEEFLLEQYRANRDAYKAVASRIFNIPAEEVNHDQRFFGKQTVLGAGYGMGAPKFMMTCARFGVTITEKKSKQVISSYRESVPAIVQFWKTIERAALRAMITGKMVRFAKGRLSFHLDRLPNKFEVLYLTLPSGRRMAYPEPRVENIEKWGQVRPTLVFKTYYRGMWVDEETYGGKLTENVIQGITRDLLAEGMVAVDKAGLPVILHVHDEIGAEQKTGECLVEEFERLVCSCRDWAKGFPVKAEGKVIRRYSK
jgi:DNA polymerase